MAPPRYPQTVKDGRCSWGDDYAPYVNDQPMPLILISSSYDGGGLFIRDMKIVHMHPDPFWMMLLMNDGQQYWPIATVHIPECTETFPITVDIIASIPGVKEDDPGIMMAPGRWLYVHPIVTPIENMTYYVSCVGGEYIAS